MPETDAFISHMSGVRFVRYMAELAGLPPEPALERAHEAFFYVGLGEARYRKLGTYSLGMKQLAKLAQAIAHGPRLLLLDEPTNGLDPPARQRMIRLIREIREVEGMYVLISSHLLRDVEETCEEVLILKDGRIAAHSDLEAERRSNRRSSSWKPSAPAPRSPERSRAWAASAPSIRTARASSGSSWCCRRRSRCASCSAWPRSTACRSGA